MEARSAAFDERVVLGGRAVVEADLVRDGELLYEDVPIQLGAQVPVDGDAPVRRTLRCSVVDEDGTFVPTLASDPLSVYGSELHVRAGFRLPGGTVETVPQGVFRVQDVDPDSMGIVPIVGEDRSVVVSAAKWETPYVIGAGTNVGTAIQTGLENRYPGGVYVFSPTSFTLPLTVFKEGDDPWADFRKLARDAGMELFFDTLGRRVLRPIPDPTVDPSVWDYVPGPGNLLLSATNRQSGRPIRNVVVALGEGSGVTTPLRSVAEVTDPSSPVYPGAIGRRVTTVRSPAITSQAQADAVAAGELQRETARSEQFRFTAAPHPAHDAGDVVRALEERTEVDVFVVLQAFTLDLSLLTPTTYETGARRSVA